MVTMTRVASAVTRMAVIVMTVVGMIRFACCGRRVRRRMVGMIQVRTHTPD
ncbi:hypothetical protein DE4587_01754 [Mycobacteroides salmoniphilum]|nr:hypothetical protein DE4586_01838 [Mycobacteroides salmoniphilum]TDZ89377.1 hypothetical protein DE4587_01754 [Mycobacteroides salmoniphilum]